MKNKLFLAIFALLFAVQAWGQSFSAQNDGVTFYYKVIGKNNVEVTNKNTLVTYASFSGDVTIPSKVTYKGKEYTVTKIGEKAFADNKRLEGVTLPETLTEISKRAFQGCTSLKEFHIPNSVEKIGEYALADCSSLEEVTLPDHWTWINACLFENCKSLNHIVLPNSLQTIDINCFKGSGLKTIVLPSSTFKIRLGALGDVKEVTFMGAQPPQHIDLGVFNNVDAIYVPSCYLDVYKKKWKLTNYGKKLKSVPTYMIKSGYWDVPENWIGPDGKVLRKLPDFSDKHVCVGYDEEREQTVTIRTDVKVKSMEIYTGSPIVGSYENSLLQTITGFKGGATLVIEDGGKLEVEDRIYKCNSQNSDSKVSMIIKDKGQLVQYNDDIEAMFVRKITKWEAYNSPKKSWDFISSPFDNTKFSDFIGDFSGDEYDIYEWRDCEINAEPAEHGGAPGWVSYKEADGFGDVFKKGTGYLATYKTEEYAHCIGVFKNLPSSTYVFEDNSPIVDGNWNLTLFGNPMSHNLNWADFKKTGYADGFITMESGTYKYHTDGEISVGRGFFVHKTESADNIHKLEYKYNSSVGSKSWSAESINVTVSNSKGSDNTIVSLCGSEETGIVKMLNPNEEVSTIYTISEGQQYGINNYDADVEEVPLYFEAKDMATYTIAVEPTSGIRYLHLYDRMTGVDTDMLRWGEYKFNALSGEVGNRFVLRLAEGTDDDGANGNFVYQSGNMLYINEFGTVQIIDMTGRFIMSEFVGDSSIDISSLRKSAAYIVRLVNDKTVKTQKIVVL